MKQDLNALELDIIDSLTETYKLKARLPAKPNKNQQLQENETDLDSKRNNSGAHEDREAILMTVVWETWRG